MALNTVSFNENAALWGGAMGLSKSSNAFVSNCSFTNNSATDGGGAISMSSSSTVSLNNSILSGNAKNAPCTVLLNFEFHSCLDAML